MYDVIVYKFYRFSAESCLRACYDLKIISEGNGVNTLKTGFEWYKGIVKCKIT